MTASLQQIEDTYTALDGIAYTLTNQAQLDLPARADTLASLSPAKAAPIVDEVLRFEDLLLGSSDTRSAVVRWSDGSESQPLAWYAGEILVCEGGARAASRPRGCAPGPASARLGERREEMDLQLARRGRCVYRSVSDENATPHGQEMPQASAESIQRLHDQSVTVAKMLKAGVELRA